MAWLTGCPLKQGSVVLIGHKIGLQGNVVLSMQVHLAIERDPAASFFAAVARRRQGAEDHGHGYLVVHLLLVAFLRVAPAFPGAGRIDDAGPTRGRDLFYCGARGVGRRLPRPLGRFFQCKSSYTVTGVKCRLDAYASNNIVIEFRV